MEVISVERIAESLENIEKEFIQKVDSIIDNHISKVQDGIEEIRKSSMTIIKEICDKEEIVKLLYALKKENIDLYNHSLNVAILSVLTAIKLDLSQKEIQDIGIGSLMHDLGLKYLNINYIDISPDEMTADTLFEYKKHTLYGLSSVQKEGWMNNEVKNIILSHHEYVNGKGYPFKQKVLSLSARIVAVIDTFDEIIRGIGCKKRKVREAVEFIRTNRDICFDGRIVDTFFDFIAVYPIGTTIMTNNGDEAVVIEQNEHFTDRPKIRLIKNRLGMIYNTEKIVNLADDLSIYIDKIKE